MSATLIFQREKETELLLFFKIIKEKVRLCCKNIGSKLTNVRKKHLTIFLSRKLQLASHAYNQDF